MICDRSVVEGVIEMDWINNRLAYINGNGEVPACEGNYKKTCLEGAKDPHFTYASELETKLVQCPIGEEKVGTVCCDSGSDRYSVCDRGANGRPKDKKSCCFLKL